MRIHTYVYVYVYIYEPRTRIPTLPYKINLNLWEKFVSGSLTVSVVASGPESLPRENIFRLSCSIYYVVSGQIRTSEWIGKNSQRVYSGARLGILTLAGSNNFRYLHNLF